MKTAGRITILLFIYALIPLTGISKNYTVRNSSPYKITALGVEPGDTIFMDPSRTIPLLFYGIAGEKDRPVVIINKGGICHIDGGTVNIRFERCHYIKVTGTGEKDIPYGLKLSNSVVQALTIGLFCDNFEVDHVEITGAGFSGITAKTDDYLSFAKTEEEKNYVLKNLKLHHNYIHHLKGGEGYYVGHNAWPVDAKGKKQHNVENVEIYDNLIEYTPREAVQVEACPTGTNSIHHNTIKYFGTIYTDSSNIKPEKDDQQNNGIQMGQGFSGGCFNNWVENGPGKGIQIVGTGDVNIYNNIIISPGVWAFYVGGGHETIKENSTINIFNNTIVKSGWEAIKFDPRQSSVTGNFYNNIVYNARGIKDPSGKSGIFTDEKTLRSYNIFTSDSSKIKFVDLKNNDFRLQKGSAAIDKGFDTSNPPVKFRLLFDYRGDSISDDPKKGDHLTDIGAFQYIGN